MRTGRHRVAWTLGGGDAAPGSRALTELMAPNNLDLSGGNRKAM